MRLTLYARCDEDFAKRFCSDIAAEFFTTERNKYMVVDGGELPTTLQIVVDGRNGRFMQWHETALSKFGFANHQSFRRLLFLGFVIGVRSTSGRSAALGRLGPLARKN